MTMAANPRRVERVLPGTIFSFDMVYSVEEVDVAGKAKLKFSEEQVKKDLENILTSLEMIQQESIGGYASRGYGKVQFTFTKFLTRSLGFYKGSDNCEAGKSDPGGFTINEARGIVPDLVAFLKKESGNALSD
jgi:CRISPR-associated protein Csm3